MMHLHIGERPARLWQPDPDEMEAFSGTLGTQNPRVRWRSVACLIFELL